MPLAVFRADASPDIGGGHVMRCLTLARFLRQLGWECAFAVRAGTRDTVPVLAEHVACIEEIGGALADEPAQLARLFPAAGLLVADHYRWDAALERQCRGWAKRIMVIDDLADRAHDCNLLLDQTFGRDAGDYARLVPEGARILAGADYALLRPEFRALRAQALERRAKAGGVRRVLVNLGASDPNGMTARVLRAIAESGLDARIDVVPGVLKDAPGVADAVAAMPQDVTFHGFGADMARLMADADLAIGGAGATSWERCCLGLPALMIVTADNQQMIARNLQEAGAAHVLDIGGEGDVAVAAQQISDFASSPETLMQTGARSAAVCDGLGCALVCTELDGHRASDGQRVYLRRAAADDAQMLYDWQCHPETRRYARDPNVPDRDEHELWMTRTLGHPVNLFFIIVHGDTPAGVLRLDHLEGRRYEVSIYVAPDRYRLGIARQALDLARTVLPAADLVAVILPENRASLKLFAAAGYVEEKDGVFVNSSRRTAKEAATA